MTTSPDPDYGVFGDAGMPRYIPPPPSKADLERAMRLRRQRERDRRTSSDFNRHMIDLFNAARKGQP